MGGFDRILSFEMALAGRSSGGAWRNRRRDMDMDEMLDRAMNDPEFQRRRKIYHEAFLEEMVMVSGDLEIARQKGREALEKLGN